MCFSQSLLNVFDSERHFHVRLYVIHKQWLFAMVPLSAYWDSKGLYWFMSVDGMWLTAHLYDDNTLIPRGSGSVVLLCALCVIYRHEVWFKQQHVYWSGTLNSSVKSISVINNRWCSLSNVNCFFELGMLYVAVTWLTRSRLHPGQWESSYLVMWEHPSSFCR